MRFYTIEPENNGNWNMMYASKCPPNSSVSETWTMRGIEHDGARIVFEEYEFYDKDPDGVREAYGCVYDSEHTLTVNVSEADPEKLFVYTVEKSGHIRRDLNLSMDDVRATYIFIEPQNFDDERLLSATEAAENAQYFADEVQNVLIRELLGGREDVVCLMFFRNRR